MTKQSASMNISKHIHDMSQSEPDQSMARNEGPGMGRNMGTCRSTSISSNKAVLSSNVWSMMAVHVYKMKCRIIRTNKGGIANKDPQEYLYTNILYV